MSVVEPEFAYERRAVSERLQMWVDGVGGFTILLADRINIGQALVSAQVDLAIMGDISRRHAAIRRSGSEYILDPFSEVQQNDKAMQSSSLLKNHDQIRLGRGVQLEFTQPHPLSSSAVLSLISRHRTEPASDAIILLADSLLLGPKKTNHIRCPNWQSDVVIFRQGSKLRLKSKTRLLQGDRSDAVSTIRLGESVQGEEISFCLEPISKS